MTKLKVTSKFKLFVIISAALIIIGMAVGTIGHFLMNGFFNYGGEFSSYKSVVVRYSSAEYTEDTVKSVCEDALSGSKGAYGVSYSEATNGGEIVYKFSANASDEMLEKIANKINETLNPDQSEEFVALNVASVRVGTVKEGGSRAVIYAAIAISAAVAFQFIYYIFRYKLRAAVCALLANVHNLGLFVALVALTRIPVGADLIALCALTVVLTMIGCGVFFDKTRKNFKNANYADVERAEIIDISAGESHKINMITVMAFAIVGIVFGIFAIIAATTVNALFIIPLTMASALACCYGTIYLTPSVFAKFDALFEKLKITGKDKKKDEKNRPADPDKAQA